MSSISSTTDPKNNLNEEKNDKDASPTSAPLLLQKTFDSKTKSITIRLNPDYISHYEQQQTDTNLSTTTKPNESPLPNYKRQKYDIPPIEHSENAASSPPYIIPESVLQYERQMRKMKAANRAGSILTKEQHLQLLYLDDHMIAVNKPSGVLTVPGVNHNPSMVQLVYDEYGPSNDKGHDRDSGDSDTTMTVDKMIVHRLDMDTSGVVVFARTIQALKALQKSFRDRTVDKTYEALVCGHVQFSEQDLECDRGTIDLALQRDHRFPPFMRVATPQSESEALKVVHELKNHGWKKIIKKKPKPSTTYFEILNATELYQDTYPATRIKLTPITGRTHQLRVHLAAIGHPIIGDPAYGIMGEACPNGGLEEEDSSSSSTAGRASLELQKNINDKVEQMDQCMCLHAKVLKIPHPVTGEMIVIQAEPSF